MCTHSKQCHTGSWEWIFFLRPHTYRFGAGRSALRERCLQTVFSAQQRCHLDNFRYFDVFGDNFVISLVFPLCLLCFVSLTVSKLLQRKYKGKTREMTKLSPKISKYRKLKKTQLGSFFTLLNPALTDYEVDRPNNAICGALKLLDLKVGDTYPRFDWKYGKWGKFLKRCHFFAI